MTGGRPAFFALVAAALAPLPLVSGACSSPEALAGKDGQCLQTTDCQQGLFCVPQKSGIKTCSTDLSSIVSTEEAGAADAQARAEGGEAGAVREGGTPDTGASAEGAPPAESGAPAEAQAPADDGGASEAGD